MGFIMDSEEKRYFPLFVNLKDVKTVIIGGGSIAQRRALVLSDFCGDITLVSPDITNGLKELSDAGRIRVIKRKYERSDIEGAAVVLALTDDAKLNERIHDDCKELGILVNVSTDKSLCDFYFPSVVRKGSMVAGICASGTAHKKVKEIRETVEEAMKEVLKEEEA